MKKVLFTLFVLGALISGNEVQAQLSKAGTAAGEFLRIPVGSRSAGMSAYAAAVNDPSAMVLNPAASHTQ